MSVNGSSTAEHVVLLHGIWMRGFSLTVLKRRLEGAGYRTSLIEYASVVRGPEPSVARVVDHALRLGSTRLHFVGHSLGGLIALQALQRAPQLPPGNVVCLGSPLRGSAAARGLTRLPGGGWLMGKSADLLRAGLDEGWSVPRAVGMIAGSRPVGLGSVVGPLRAPHDGTVSVEETRSPGLGDHLVVDVTHTGLVFSEVVAQQTVKFLRDGRFEHAGTA